MSVGRSQWSSWTGKALPWARKAIGGTLPEIELTALAADTMEVG